MGRHRKRQEFRADVIQKWGDEGSRLLWFSTDPKKAPPQVCLLISSVDKRPRAQCALELELNGQENCRNGLEVASLEASRTMLRVRFRRGFGVLPGCVDGSEEPPVSEVLVRFALADMDYAFLVALLEAGRQDGCKVGCRPGGKPRRTPTPVAVVPPR